MNTLQLFKQTREIANETFCNSLKALLEAGTSFSETDLKQTWLTALQKQTDLFPTGWYIPPPQGIAALFASEKEPMRTSFKTLREEPFWPKPDIFFQKQGLFSFYASPVHTSGVIGDFGATLYLGENKKIQNHFKNSYELVQTIFTKIEIGMTFAQVYTLAESLMNRQGMYSHLLSPTDPTRTNIGHTIVALDPQELSSVENGIKSWSQTTQILSKKRIFINAKEETKITPGMAFTLEPRPQVIDDPSIPMAWFHSIAVFDEHGEKQFITGFEKLFSLLKLTYML